MVDFRFYLNKQGIRGQKGEKGETGFSPSIVEEVNTLTDYRLKIINEFDEFVTDNLRGSDYFDITDPNGTYLRFDKESGRAYTGALDQATSEAVGGARLASTSDMEAFSENTIVTPALFADNLVNLIVSPDGSLNITQNEQTSKTEITFNSATLDAVRAELNRVKEDLTTESQVRLNADNQQQVAIDAERREREIQDAALQSQISSISNNFVTLDTNQQVSGFKNFDQVTFKNATISNGSASVQLTGNNDVVRINPLGITDLLIGNTTGINGLTLSARYGVKFEGDVPSIKKGNDYKKILSQDTVEQGDNIIVEQTTNGIKISSTASGGAIIDDENPATDKVYSSSKTSDLVGELGNEVNGIAGRLNALEDEVKVATTENLGLVQPDGTTITIDSDGKISAVGGGSSVEIDNDTIKKNSQGKLYVNNPTRWGYSSSKRTASNGDEFYTQNLSLPVEKFIASNGEAVYGQVCFEYGYGEQPDPIVSFKTIKAGTNMEITKDVYNGIITFNCTGGGSAPEVDNVTIEVNEEGKLQTTVDINELQSKVEDLQLYKFPNATIEGDPTINNGQISNFSTTNYLRFPFEFKTEGRTWLLNGSFDTDSDVTTQQNIIDSLASVALAVRSGRLVLALSTNGTSFDLGEHLSMSDIEPNTKYYYRLSFSGTQYLLSISTDKQEWLPEIIVTSDQPIASKPMTISSSGHPFKGSLNLNDYDLTVANVLVWQGMDDVGISSRLDVNASNFTETGKQTVRDIVGIDKKEDKLIATDGISIKDVSIGAFPYTESYQELVNSRSYLSFPNNQNKIYQVTDTPFGFISDNDMYMKFKFEFGNTTTSYNCWVDFNFGNTRNTVTDYLQGYRVSLNNGGYIEGSLFSPDTQTQSYFFNRVYIGNMGLDISKGSIVQVEGIWNSANRSFTTIITNLDNGLIYTTTKEQFRNDIEFVSGANIHAGSYWSFDIMEAKMKAEDMYIAKTNTTTIEHQISARIDNDTIVSDNGVLKAVSKGTSYDIGDGLILDDNIYGDFVTLTQNGTMGGNTPACQADSFESGYYPYQAFDGNVNTFAGFSGTQQTGRYITYYSPEPLLVESIDFNFKSTSERFGTGNVLFSNDNTNWEYTVPFDNAESLIAFNLDTAEVKKGFKYIRVEPTTYAGWGKFNIKLNCKAGKINRLSVDINAIKAALGLDNIMAMIDNINGSYDNGGIA